VWFPDNLVGPDAIARIQDTSPKHVLLVTIQHKLTTAAVRLKQAMDSLDPSLLYQHQERGTSGVRPYQTRASDVTSFLKRLEECRGSRVARLGVRGD